MIIEKLSPEEEALWKILQDPSGIDQAEFLWFDPGSDNNVFRARPYQWQWWRCQDNQQIDSCARSVGKSLSIIVRAFAFIFLHSGHEMVITAPLQNHLDRVVGFVADRITQTKLSMEMLKKGRSGGIVRRPQFTIQLANMSRIIGVIPHADGKNIKGIHPIWLEQDEAQDFTAEAWVEISNTLKRMPGAVWRAHGVTKGTRDDFDRFSTNPDSNWTNHKFSSMYMDEWNDDERKKMIEMYGSREDPNYLRNVLGESANSGDTIFVLRRFMKIVDDDPASNYNVNEYHRSKITETILNDRNGNIEQILHEDIPAPDSKYKIFWAGLDFGLVTDPTEILIFAEYELSTPEKNMRLKKEKKIPEDGLSCLKCIARISLHKIPPSGQRRAVRWIFERFPGMKALSMDSNGNGLPLFMDIQEESPELVNKIKGYKFGSRILIGFDDRIIVDEYNGDAVRDAGIEADPKIYGTDILRRVVDAGRIFLPDDDSMFQSFMSQTETIVKGSDDYGRRRYSKGNDHVIDAARFAFLGWTQYGIEKLLQAEVEEEIYDIAL